METKEGASICRRGLRSFGQKYKALDRYTPVRLVREISMRACNLSINGLQSRSRSSFVRTFPVLPCASCPHHHEPTDFPGERTRARRSLPSLPIKFGIHQSPSDPLFSQPCTPNPIVASAPSFIPHWFTLPIALPRLIRASTIPGVCLLPSVTHLHLPLLYSRVRRGVPHLAASAYRHSPRISFDSSE